MYQVFSKLTNESVSKVLYSKKDANDAWLNFTLLANNWNAFYVREV